MARRQHACAAAPFSSLPSHSLARCPAPTASRLHIETPSGSFDDMVTPPSFYAAGLLLNNSCHSRNDYAFLSSIGYSLYGRHTDACPMNSGSTAAVQKRACHRPAGNRRRQINNAVLFITIEQDLPVNWIRFTTGSRFKSGNVRWNAHLVRNIPQFCKSTVRLTLPRNQHGLRTGQVSISNPLPELKTQPL